MAGSTSAPIPAGAKLLVFRNEHKRGKGDPDYVLYLAVTGDAPSSQQQRPAAEPNPFRQRPAAEPNPFRQWPAVEPNPFRQRVAEPARSIAEGEPVPRQSRGCRLLDSRDMRERTENHLLREVVRSVGQPDVEAALDQPCELGMGHVVVIAAGKNYADWLEGLAVQRGLEVVDRHTPIVAPDHQGQQSVPDWLRDFEAERRALAGSDDIPF